jgi:hypothetical protein
MSGEGRVRKRRRKKVTPWQRRRRRALYVLFAFGVLLSVWLVWRLQKRAALNDALQQVAVLGVPITKADYEARFGPYVSWWNHAQKLPEDSPYQAVLKAYKGATRAMLNDMPRFIGTYDVEELEAVPYEGPMLDTLKAFTEANENTLSIFHQVALSGAKSPRSQKQVEFLIELLCMGACRRAHDGDAEDAFNSLEDGLVLLRDGERGFGNEVRAITNTHTARQLFMALESALRRIRFTDEQLTTLQAHLVAGDWKAQQLERNIEWQSSYIIEYMRGMNHEPGIAVLNILVGFHERRQANQLNGWRIGHDLIGLPLKEQRSVIAKYEGDSVHDHLRVQWLPALLTVVRTALDVVRYDQAHGVLPESLDALVPEYCEEIPIDFWSGAPIRYQADGRAFSVYSIGRDGNDDDGARKRDILFKTVLPNQN